MGLNKLTTIRKGEKLKIIEESRLVMLYCSEYPEGSEGLRGSEDTESPGASEGSEGSVPKHRAQLLSSTANSFSAP